MLFKTPEMSAQYGALHPEIRRLVADIDLKASDLGFAPFTMTEGFRTRREQTRIYTDIYLSEKYTPDEALARAEKQFSWHLCGCAIDFRNHALSTKQRAQVFAWLDERCRPPELWEVKQHNVGAGLHFHVGWRDWDKRARFLAGEAAV